MKHYLAPLLMTLVVSCLAEEQFFLKCADGTTNGPFVAKEGATVRIGQTEATVSCVRIAPDERPAEQIMPETYTLAPSVLFCEYDPVNDSAANEKLKKFFRQYGVKWPAGSAISYQPDHDMLVVSNTTENLTLIQSALRKLDPTPLQLEIQMEFVAFDQTNIATLASHSIKTPDLIRLWTNGQGQLLAAPRVLTQTGIQATVKGVTECIYPTEFMIARRPAGLSPSTGGETMGMTVEPGNFETREVGSILTVLPVVSPDGNTINLTMTPELVEEPTWRQYGLFLTTLMACSERFLQNNPSFTSTRSTPQLRLQVAQELWLVAE